MPDPTISVIVPIFNVAEYLPECLASLRAQTFGNTPSTEGLTFEVILVDDGSTDSSRAIAQEFAATQGDTHGRFTVTMQSKPNEGVSLARRDGLASAAGEWLSFVDSDDWVDSRYLEILYQTGVETGSDVVACGLVRTPRPGMSGVTIPPLSPRAGAGLQDVRFAINTYPVLWNKLWRAILIDRWLIAGGEFPGAEVSLGEDIAVTYPWIASAESVSWIPAGLYSYRVREGSAFSHRWTNPEHRRSIYFAIRHMINEAVKLGVLDCYHEEFAKVCVLHLVRSNPQEIQRAMMGDADAEQYCIRTVSLLNQYFPDWTELAAENRQEQETFVNLRNALVQI